MEQKKQVTREKLTSILAKFIKECQKSMGDKTNIELPINYESWCSGCGRNSKWSHTDIIVGSYPNKTTYTFTDRELTQEQFITMLKNAVAQSKVNAKVFYDECGDGYWCDKEYRFKRVEIFAKPCKEFITLRKYVEKYTHLTIGDLDAYYVDVCGKRSSWSDSGRYYYLCYDAKECKKILDAIKAKKGSKDVLKVSVEEYFDHGDEGDYQCAMYQESEWYGHRGTKVCVKVATPSGKVKLNKEFYF
jgi:hypothetical protein